MNIVKLPGYFDLKESEYLGKFPQSNFNFQPTNSTVFIYKDEPKFMYIKNFFSEAESNFLHSRIRTKILKTDQRGVSSGQKHINKLTKTRTLNKIKRTKALVSSSIAGYYEASGLNKYCRECAFNKRNPRIFNHLTDNYISKINDFYQTNEFLKPFYYKQLEFAKTIKNDFLIKETVFSTITMNKNFQTSYHQDAGDYKEGMSTIFLLKKGKYVGGELCMPEWDLQIKLGNGDLLFFNPHYFHGNKKITYLSKDAERITMVTYLRTGLVKC